jgi:GAF domain-containing protein
VYKQQQAGAQMILSPDFTEQTGLEVEDLREDHIFAKRNLHERDAVRQMNGLARLTRAFVENPDNILQELVDTAVELCEADSAGISVVKPDATDESYYNWVAAAGEYSPFFNAMLPRYPSACGICLERGEVQHFRVTKRFFDILGVEAAPILDGLLLPWFEGDTQGTIFVMSHKNHEAFDANDVKLMRTLADFAAMAMRNKRQQAQLLQQVELASAAAMADRLAHKINNPLQSLTNHIFLAEQDVAGSDAQQLAASLAPDLQRLAALVRDQLAVPTAAHARYGRNSGAHVAASAEQTTQTKQ